MRAIFKQFGSTGRNFSARLYKVLSILGLGTVVGKLKLSDFKTITDGIDLIWLKCLLSFDLVSSQFWQFYKFIKFIIKTIYTPFKCDKNHNTDSFEVVATPSLCLIHWNQSIEYLSETVKGF